MKTINNFPGFTAGSTFSQSNLNYYPLMVRGENFNTVVPQNPIGDAYRWAKKKLVSAEGGLCRAGCWGVGGVWGGACVALTGPALVVCLAAAGAAASNCSDSCPT